MPACASQDVTFKHVYQNIVSYYNGYFNAREIIRKSENKLADMHQDNYYTILPVYTLADEKAALSIGSDMEAVKEKCTRVIQKYELSKYQDDAYFLIAKSHFYNRDYFAAMEIFQFINTRFPGKPTAYKSMIWLIRINTELELYREAQAITTLIRNEENFLPSLKKDFWLSEADLAIRSRNYGTAISSLENAVNEINRKKDRARYQFILAQLYEARGNSLKATELFRKVARKNVNYEMKFYASIKSIRAQEINTPGKYREAKNFLENMLNDDKNVDYLDQIYYELALLELYMKNTANASEYFKLSLQHTKDNDNQRALSHLALGEYYYSLKKYIKSYNHFDSTEQYITEDFYDFDNINTKISVYKPLTQYHITVEHEDSLQYLASLNREELDRIISDLMLREKKEAEEKQRKAELDEFRVDTRPQEKPMHDVSDISQMQDQGISREWYFYNSAAIGRGFRDFTSAWGNRPLADNWRLQSLLDRQIHITDEEKQDDNSDDTVETETDEFTGFDEQFADIPVEKQNYYMQLPLLPSQKIASDNKIIEAMYNIGHINFDKLKNYDDAEMVLNQLIERFPSNRYEPQSLYILYQIYTLKEDFPMAEHIKLQLSTLYPDNEYTFLISDKAEGADLNKFQTKNPELEALFKESWNAFSLNDCNSVNFIMTKADSLFEANYLKPNFEYLNLLCEGKKSEKTELINELEFFIEAYPNADITKHAINVLQNLSLDAKPTSETQMNEELFTLNDVERHFYCMLYIGNVKDNEIRNHFSNFNNEIFSGKAYQVSTIAFNDKSIIMVQRFSDKQEGMEYYNTINNHTKFHNKLGVADYQDFIISQSNFRKLMEVKDVEQYLMFFELNYK